MMAGPEGGQKMYGPIVVGTDGSKTAAKALDRAIDIAKAFSQPLHVVSAFRSTSRSAAGVPEEFAALVFSADDVDAILQEAEARARTAGISVQLHAVEGDAADAILDTAEHLGADLIVIGNKGLGSKKRFLLGNVPSKVVHHSPCSTQVVHTT